MTDSTTEAALSQLSPKAQSLVRPALEQIATISKARARADQQHWMIGVWGGTGVGKSSLVNALLGGDYAKVSAKRPTSTQVSVYLPTGLDAEPRFRSRFGDEFNWVEIESPLRDDLILIDTPDIDSVESTHAARTAQWLPAIDLAILVTSPERYMDLKIWQSVVEQNEATPMLMVLNKSDLADPETISAWHELLNQSEFADSPRVCVSAKQNQVDSLLAEVHAALDGAENLSSQKQDKLAKSKAAIIDEQISAIEEDQRDEARIDRALEFVDSSSHSAQLMARYCEYRAAAAKELPMPVWWRWLRKASPSQDLMPSVDEAALGAQFDDLCELAGEEGLDIPLSRLHGFEPDLRNTEGLAMRTNLAKVLNSLSVAVALGLAGWTVWRLLQSQAGVTEPLGLSGMIDSLALIALAAGLLRALYWVVVPSPFEISRVQWQRQGDALIENVREQLNQAKENVRLNKQSAVQWLKDNASLL